MRGYIQIRMIRRKVYRHVGIFCRINQPTTHITLEKLVPVSTYQKRKVEWQNILRNFLFCFPKMFNIQTHSQTKSTSTRAYTACCNFNLTKMKKLLKFSYYLDEIKIETVTNKNFVQISVSEQILNQNFIYISICQRI